MEAPDPALVLRERVDELEREQEGIQTLLAAIPDSDWFRPTPSWQWDVRDTVSHLADTDEIALDTLSDGPRTLNTSSAAGWASAEEYLLDGVLRGRRQTGPAVRSWWVATSAASRATLLETDPNWRVPWGLGMRTTTFVVARLMETWAHGLDIRAALGTPVATPGPRLVLIAGLGLRALPYAFRFAGLDAAPPAVRVECVAADGTPYEFGPPQAPDRITGSLEQLCEVLVRRRGGEDAPGLTAVGPGARLVLQHARAFL